MATIWITSEDGAKASLASDDARLLAYLRRALEHVALWDRDAEAFVAPVPSSGAVTWYEPLRGAGAAGTVTLPRAVALIVDQAFLPLNPNKLRGAGAGVKEAAHAFRNAVRAGA